MKEAVGNVAVPAAGRVERAATETGGVETEAAEIGGIGREGEETFGVEREGVETGEYEAKPMETDGVGSVEEADGEAEEREVTRPVETEGTHEGTTVAGGWVTATMFPAGGWVTAMMFPLY